MSAGASYSLRRWEDSDRAPFAAMNADPVVMEFFPSVLTREQSDAFVDRIQERWSVYGWGLWALEVDGDFAGFVGLSPVAFLDGEVEIGWRLARRFWGKGLATAAASEVRDYAFTAIGLPGIVSFTTVSNVRSQRVMQKIGMTFAEEFDHPAVDGPMKRHVLYRLATTQMRS